MVYLKSMSNPAAAKVLEESQKFRELIPELLTTLAGRWVVFKEGKVVKDFPTEDEAYRFGLENFGPEGGQLVFQVVAEEVIPILSTMHTPYLMNKDNLIEAITLAVHRRDEALLAVESANKAVERAEQEILRLELGGSVPRGVIGRKIKESLDAGITDRGDIAVHVYGQNGPGQRRKVAAQIHYLKSQGRLSG